MADEVVKASTHTTTAASFLAGLPSNPALMVAAGGADVVQYFGFAINMAQKIAYLFGQDELFNGGASELSEDAKMRIVAYLGAMFGASGAALLIVTTSRKLAVNLGEKVSAKALTTTIWYPLVRRTAAVIGKQITKSTVGKVVTKVVPILGGVASGALTYATFIPMGRRLADTLAGILNGDFNIEKELNAEFAASLQDQDVEEVPVQVEVVPDPAAITIEDDGGSGQDRNDAGAMPVAPPDAPCSSSV
jgi:hypothetical protein